MRRVTWRGALLWLVLVASALIVLTWPAWRAMVHQWTAIDTYRHLQLVPAILIWLAWLKRGELAKVEPRGWWPGLVVVAGGCALHAAGMALAINTIAQVGAVLAVQGAVLALVGPRAAALLGFVLLFAFALVPVGDEFIPPLQQLTAQMVSAMTQWSGVPVRTDGIHLYTPAGRFNVAEECAGVKFLIATVTWGILLAYAGLTRWRDRIVFVLACAAVSVLANAVRAWATIYVAQWVGAEAAGGVDHIVYGWIFFAVVLAILFAAVRPWLDGYPADAGWSAGDLEQSGALRQAERAGGSTAAVALSALVLTGAFALALRLA